MFLWKLIRAAVSFIGAIISFLLSILIAVFALFALGWIFRVLLGGETSSQYLQRYLDFYHHPAETPLGQWALELWTRFRS